MSVSQPAQSCHPACLPAVTGLPDANGVRLLARSGYCPPPPLATRAHTSAWCSYSHPGNTEGRAGLRHSWKWIPKEFKVQTLVAGMVGSHAMTLQLGRPDGVKMQEPRSVSWGSLGLCVLRRSQEYGCWPRDDTLSSEAVTWGFC